MQLFGNLLRETEYSYGVSLELEYRYKVDWNAYGMFQRYLQVFAPS